MEQYKLRKNKSKVYCDGSEWVSNEGLKYKIIGQIDRKYKNDYLYFLCKFEDGTLVEARRNHIWDGQIKNPNHPTICGVGYYGIGKWKATKNYKQTSEYRLWTRIIHCCYNPEDKDYINYGAMGVIVDETWHNFQQFCEDIQYLKGYNEWKSSKNYEIDKDILCDELNISPKIYSKYTCVFMPKFKNNSYSHLSGKVYIAKRISDDYEEEFANMSEFARKYNLQYQNISSCIRQKVRQHKGWTFKIKE